MPISIFYKIKPSKKMAAPPVKNSDEILQ
uniref:Uncharacterized protein n=1 Tax=Arundo donax TaxID=35708 RepID=A0A0A9A1D5_ARUDO